MESIREILIFELGGERYGLSLDAVQEVVRAVAVTRLPGAPPIVEGVIDVRGRAVPVLDLRARFGLPPAAISPEEHMILAATRGRLVAIRADRATRLERLDDAAIEAPERISPKLKHIAGVAMLRDGLTLIHDLETFLTQAEAEALDEAMASVER